MAHVALRRNHQVMSHLFTAVLLLHPLTRWMISVQAAMHIASYDPAIHSKDQTDGVIGSPFLSYIWHFKRRGTLKVGQDNLPEKQQQLAWGTAPPSEDDDVEETSREETEKYERRNWLRRRVSISPLNIELLYSCDSHKQYSAASKKGLKKLCLHYTNYI